MCFPEIHHGVISFTQSERACNMNDQNFSVQRNQQVFLRVVLRALVAIQDICKTFQNSCSSKLLRNFPDACTSTSKQAWNKLTNQLPPDMESKINFQENTNYSSNINRIVIRSERSPEQLRRHRSLPARIICPFINTNSWAKVKA